jgi:putative ABC transport system permease protein
MAGLTRVELGFALTLAGAAAGLVLWLGLNERRRTFAIAAALGATRRQLGGFVWTEAAYVTIGGLLTGAAAAWALTEILIQILTGVFDPPPETLAVPWSYLGLIAGVAVLAVGIAAAAVIRSTRRPTVQLLREI